MKTIELADGTFSIEDRGSGVPLLLVHGFPLDHSMWHAQIETFAATHRVIAPDLRGFGGSTVTAETVTMQRHADDLAGILDALEIQQPVVLCGLSMGGYIACQFWKHHAHRLRGMILCDTKASGDSDEVARGREFMAARVAKEGMGFVPEAMLPKLVAQKTFESNRPLVDSLRQMILDAPPAGVAASQRGMATRPDFTSQLHAIDLPALVLVGAQDVISTSDEMRSIATAMTDARFVEIPDAGHMTPMENPIAVNAAIEALLSELA